MKVLIADKFPEAGRDAVARAGLEVVYDPELNDAALTAAVRSTGADVLVVRGTKVPAAMLAAGRLSLVVRAGAGYDTIDVAAASARVGEGLDDGPDALVGMRGFLLDVSQLLFHNIAAHLDVWPAKVHGRHHTEALQKRGKSPVMSPGGVAA